MDEQVPALAELSFVSLKDTSSIALDALNFQVEEVRIREGRLKEQLPFTHQNERLLITHPKGFQAGKAYSLSIKYSLRYDHEKHAANWLGTADYLVFNPYARQIFGRSGTFFPSVAGESYQFNFNVSLPKSLSLELPGEIQFQTDNLDGSVSQYWHSGKPMHPEAFYLIIGEFDEEDLLAVQDDIQFKGIDGSKLTARKVEARVEQAEEALGLEDLTDSEYVRVDSLAELETQEFYVSRKDLPGISPDQFRLNKTIFQEYAQGDAEKKLYNFYREKIGEAWHQKLLQKKWQQFDTLPQDEKWMALSFYLENYRDENAFLQDLDQKALDTGFYQPLLKSLRLPKLQVNYRYVGAENELWVVVSQDTSTAPAYSLPSQAYLLSAGDSIGRTAILNGAADTMRISTSGAPSYAHLSFGNNFPGRVVQNKPDTYWLYQLSHAQGEQKTQALLQLFSTTNKNLRSTVLGIAMDDPDADIRLEALLAADDMDTAAQQKLKDTILHLAGEDPSAEVQQAAQKLATKYYTAK